MLIDHNNIIQKTNLRQNLASILSRVYKGDTIYISDRGLIKATIKAVEGPNKKKRKLKKLMAQLNEIRDQLAASRLGKEDSAVTIRRMRDDRSDYLFERDGK